MFEGHKKVEYLVDDEGRVVRHVAGFYGGNYIPTAAKVVAESVDEFRAKHPDIRIVNLVEREVVKAAPVDLRHKISQLSDEELALMGLSRVQPKQEPKETPIPKDFPGDFALRRAGVTVEKLATMSRDELLAIDGIGERLADKIIAARGGQKAE